MAYYLTDPYYYLPKCYPFLGKRWTYTPLQPSSRLTPKSKQVQDECATQRLNFTAGSFCDRSRCQENLLRCRMKLQDKENSQYMSHVLTNRKGKEKCLREKGHKFPSFVKSQHIMEEYKAAERSMK